MPKTLLAITVVIGLATSSAVGAGQLSRSTHANSVPVRTDSRLWLEGGSNVRDWTCKATAMEASIEFEGKRAGDYADEVAAVRGAFVKVPVRMLKCGDRHMEAHMYEALKAPSASVQSFIIAQLDGIPVTEGVSKTVEVTGVLSIAGVSRPIRI